jgi:hypothetical protein
MNIDRLPIFENQLIHYVNACERGYHIDIILASRYEHWKSFTNSSKLFCSRTQSKLSVEYPKFNSSLPKRCDNSNKFLYLAQHRCIFLSHINQYDFYINQEDDSLISVHTIDYFIKWQHIYSMYDKNIIPGFIEYELPLENYLNYRSGSIMEVNGVFIVSKINKYPSIIFQTVRQRSFMMSNIHLQRFSILPEWIEDIGLPFNEPNVHFHSRWLCRHVRLVIPIEDFYHSMLHHMTDKYINLKLGGTYNFTGHNIAVEGNEYVEFLLAVFEYKINPPGDHHSWFITLINDNDGISPIDCLNQDRPVYIKSKFQEPFPLPVPRHSHVRVSARCSCAVFVQNIERCQKHVTTEACHPYLIVNGSRTDIPWKIPQSALEHCNK